MTTSHRKELPRCIFLANYVQTSDLVVVDVLQKPLVHFPVSCLEQSKPGDHDDDVVLHGGGDGDGQKNTVFVCLFTRKRRLPKAHRTPVLFSNLTALKQVAARRLQQAINNIIKG